MRKAVIYLLLAAVCCGCGSEKRAVAPAEDKKIRVVALSPAVAEIVLHLGGKAQLAGRCTACNIPEISDVPALGKLGMPFTEPVLQSGAQAVISDLSAPSPAWEMLKKCGVKCVTLSAARVADMPANIRKIGSELHREREAETCAAEVERTLAGLRRDAPPRRLRALVVISVPPAVSCGRESFITELVELAGAESISAAVSGSYFALSTEFIVESSPEVIVSFLPPEQTEKFFARTEFRQLPAVKNRRFCYPEPDNFCRLSPGALDEVKKLRLQLRDFSK